MSQCTVSEGNTSTISTCRLQQVQRPMVSALVGPRHPLHAYAVRGYTRLPQVWRVARKPYWECGGLIAQVSQAWGLVGLCPSYHYHIECFTYTRLRAVLCLPKLPSSFLPRLVAQVCLTHCQFLPLLQSDRHNGFSKKL